MRVTTKSGAMRSLEILAQELASPIGRAAVSEAMRGALRLRADADAGEAAALMRAGPDETAAVVDRDGAFVGTVALADLDGARTVGERLRSDAIVFAPTETVARAAAVLAFERRLEAMVVDERRRVLGQLTALDLLRWLACAGGFLVPAPPR